jgi:hypothetical protein
MSVSCRRFGFVSLLAVAWLSGPWALAQGLADAVPAAPIMPNPAKQTQTVRLSFVEGDVRISRGKQGEKETGAEWEKAEVNLAVEPGFSLATGKGARAEIEFEDASTMYLGENSALSFGELSSKAGVTHSAVELISGTLTLNLHPAPGEWFKMRTPGGGQLTVPYPDHSMTRLNRYLDATSVTPLEDTTMQLLNKTKTQVFAGNTIVVHDGADGVPVPRSSTSYKAWDSWVLDRIKVRDELMAQVMGQSGLTKPLAGLPDMEGQGTFFDCAPMGDAGSRRTAGVRPRMLRRSRRVLRNSVCHLRLQPQILSV